MKQIPKTILWTIEALALALATIFSSPVFAAPRDADETETPGTIVLRMRSDVEVTGWNVRLADVADLEGGVEGDRTALGETVLGLAPSVGETYRVGRKFVAEKLVSSGLDTSNLRFAGSSVTRLRPATQNLSGVRLQREAHAELESVLSGTGPAGARVEIEPGETPRDRLLPAGRDGTSIEYRARTRTMRTGTSWVDARIMIDGRSYPTVAIPFRIRAIAEVLVPLRPIERDEPLGPENLELAEMDLPANVTTRPLTDFRDVEGRLARRALRTGEILTARAAYRPFVVRRGDPVSMRLIDGTLHLNTRGVAEENGYVGQKIAVKNSASGRSVQARVVDADTVRVELPKARSNRERARN